MALKHLMMTMVKLEVEVHTGQGTPLDKNSRYIYFQVGMPVIASPSPPSPGPSTVPQTVEADIPYYFPRLHTNIS